MKLSIKNFAKIKNADIIVDGITVIAGENNTGKSTVGKIFFSFFNALNDIEDKISGERLNEIDRTNRLVLRKYMSSLDMSRSMLTKNVMNMSGRIRLRIRHMMQENLTVSEEKTRDIVEKSLKSFGNTLKLETMDEWQTMVDELVENIREILLLPEETIILEVISRYFNLVFFDQMNSLSGDESDEAVLGLEIKGKTERLLFTDNRCRYAGNELNIIHKAIYIDNPFIIDELSGYNELNPMNELLKDLLTGDTGDGVFDGVIEAVRAKDKLSDIDQALRSVVDGEVVLGQDEEFYLRDKNFDKPISFHNLSTGLKSFVILKMLIEKGCLKEKDVIILDEPEIHLHPQWQIAYAELIVLLQKHFDLSVIVTTHSPYFMDAIDLYSHKHGINDKVNYYLSSNVNDEIQMDLVNGNIDLIYRKMATPIQALDTLRYELNND